jgi:hypothetical protein
MTAVNYWVHFFVRAAQVSDAGTTTYFTWMHLLIAEFGLDQEFR